MIGKLFMIEIEGQGPSFCPGRMYCWAKIGRQEEVRVENTRGNLAYFLQVQNTISKSNLNSYVVESGLSYKCIISPELPTPRKAALLPHKATDSLKAAVRSLSRGSKAIPLYWL
jgi:hypothetical protein